MRQGKEPRATPWVRSNWKGERCKREGGEEGRSDESEADHPVGGCAGERCSVGGAGYLEMVGAISGTAYRVP